MPHNVSHPRRLRTGFTLVELMVSIALVLILILGVNQVFRIATDAVGAGQALSDNTRENRAIQAVLFNDLQQAIIRSNDSPCFIIRSTRTSAFKDQQEELGDRDYAVVAGTTSQANIDRAIRTADLDGDNAETVGTVDEIPRNHLTRRNFRQDVMAFFARHLYPRQTANDGSYVADMTSNEAFIWYGQLRQPQDFTSSASVNKNPGWEVSSGAQDTAQSNPNNFYARQWALGRVAMLLRAPDSSNQIVDKNGIVQRYIGRVAGVGPTNYGPLGQDSVSTNGTVMDPLPPSTAGTRIQYSRYDVAGTTIDSYRGILKDYVFPGVPTLPPGSSVWYGAGGLSYRFTGFQYPTKPLSSYGVARTTPWLVSGCTHFIVEYAGNFLNQDPANGSVIGDYSTGVDGEIDYVIDASGARQVRWYGYPRDVSGVSLATVGRPDGTITRQVTPGAFPASPDVLPLRDFLSAGALVVTAPLASSVADKSPGAAFEHFVGNTFPSTNYNATNSPGIGASYIVAWQPPGTYVDATGAPVGDPPKPLMIRVSLTIDDPAGRLPEGQTYEYVIELP